MVTVLNSCSNVLVSRLYDIGPRLYCELSGAGNLFPCFLQHLDPSDS